MARSVSGLFGDAAHVDSIVGALRDAGFENERISVVSPDSPPPAEAAPSEAVHGTRGWIVEHLLHRGHPRDTAHAYRDRVLEGRQLVTVQIRNDLEDGDARNLMVTTGASEISSVADGKLIPIV